MVSFIPLEGFNYQVQYMGNSDFTAHRGVYSMHMGCFPETSGFQMIGKSRLYTQVPSQRLDVPQGYLFILPRGFCIHLGSNVVYLQSLWYCNYPTGVLTIRSQLPTLRKLMAPHTTLQGYINLENVIQFPRIHCTPHAPHRGVTTLVK